jgi:putative inorganic carbon (hco3(-)) transporter
VLTNILTFFSLQPADSFWQETISSSRVIRICRSFGSLLSFGIRSALLGNCLQSLSFLTTLALFSAIALPEFTDDKELLALFPLVGFMLWLLGRILGGKESRRPISSDVLVILYICINIIAAASSHYFYPSLRGLAKVAVYGLSYFLFTAQMSHSGSRKLLVTYVLLVSGTLVALYGLYQYHTGVAPLATWEDPNIETQAVRIYSTLKNPNLLAGYLVPLVPLSVSLALAAIASRRWLISLISASSAAILSVATILTGSRGGYLGLMGALIFLAIISGGYLWRTKPNSRLYICSLAILLPLLAVAAFHYLPAFEQRFLSIFAGREHSSNSFRMNVWLSSLAMLHDNWWLGVGVGNQAFVLAYGLYMHTGYDALGTYCVPLEVGVETGMVGLLVFFLMVVASLCRGHLGFTKEQSVWQRWLIAGAAAALVGLMTHGLVDTVFYRPQVQFLFWLIISLLVSSTFKSDQKSIAPKFA